MARRLGVHLGEAALLAAALGGCRGGGAQPDAELFPFTIPWDDDAPSVANVSEWNEKPAGKSGFITVQDGHFIDGAGRRVRFLGTNLTLAAALPPHDVAEKVARRMAKFGINLVRLHRLDAFVYPRGLLDGSQLDHQHLSPEALDRLDYFVYQLRENGIYSNLNLYCSRKLTEVDGIEAARALPPMHKGVSNFHPRLIELQRAYARDLLTHVNPYTGNAYAVEPAVAMVEINNENAIAKSWRDGEIDALPDYLQGLLDERWQTWLRGKYADTAALQAAWGEGAQAGAGPELLRNGDFAEGTAGWTLQLGGAAAADFTITDDGPEGKRAARISVTATSTAPWHVQLRQAGLPVEQGRAYRLAFWAKAAPDRQLAVSCARGSAPGGALGLSDAAKLTGQWQRLEFTFRASATDPQAQVRIGGLALQAGAVWIAGGSLREGGVGRLGARESLEQGTIGRPRRGQISGRSACSVRDYLTFLADLETEYWTGMHTYLKQDLGVRQPVTGTQMGWTPPQTHTAMEFLDTHAYWQHPVYADRRGDPTNWRVGSEPMTDAPPGTLARLGALRVDGAPYTVSEYNHPAPNTHASEAFLLLGAYGALQDWDGLVQFMYGNDDQWEFDRIAGFFDLRAHATQLVTLPAAAALFRRGDVDPAREAAVAHTNPEQIAAMGAVDPLAGALATAYGIDPRTVLSHRVALSLEDGAPGVRGPSQPLTPAPGAYASDTGQLLWRGGPGSGRVTVNTPRSKAFVGRATQGAEALGEVTLEIGKTRQDWAAITLTAMDGPDFVSPGRVLLTATGDFANTGWSRQAEGDRVTVRDQWGRAPVLVEGIPATITLPVAASRVKAHALDGSGARAGEVPVAGDAQAVLTIGPQYRTLWYEIAIE
jgi:hypothetical protein